MLSRLRAAGLIWPTLFAVPGLALLVGLGHWQMQRKAWKEGLLAQIRERVTLPPASIENIATASHKDESELEYTRVRAKGRFLHGLERHVYWPANGTMGWLIHTPMQLESGWILLVNRGWVPDALKDPAKRPEGQASGIAEVIGLIRMQEGAGAFTPSNDLSRNSWFWRDISSMLRCSDAERSKADCKVLEAGGTGGKRPAALWFLVDQEAEPVPPGGWPRGGTTNLKLSNRHLEYALTWYGLAVTLVGVWIAYAISRLRQSGSNG